MNCLRLLTISIGLSVLAAVSGRCETLVNNSPFLPHGNNGAHDIAKSTDTLELRGAMAGPFGRQFYIYDTSKKHGVWVGQDDHDNQITIVADNADEGSVAIKLGDGRLMNLKMHEAKTASSAVDASPISVAATSVGANPRGPRRVVTETQTAWNEELQRRLAENGAKN